MHHNMDISLLNCDHPGIGTVVPNMTVVRFDNLSRSNLQSQAKRYLTANGVKGLQSRLIIGQFCCEVISG